MNRQEITAILKLIKVSYPSFYKDMTKESANDTIDVWAMIFANDDAKVVIEAVKALITSLKYPPTIADVKEKVRFLRSPNEMTELEAWNKVKKAMNYYDADITFKELPPVLQDLVGSPGQLREWANMDLNDINTVVQSNFMRSYKARAKHEKELEALPESTKEMLKGITQIVLEGKTIDDWGDK